MHVRRSINIEGSVGGMERQKMDGVKNWMPKGDGRVVTVRCLMPWTKKHVGASLRGDE